MKPVSSNLLPLSAQTLAFKGLQSITEVELKAAEVQCGVISAFTAGRAELLDIGGVPPPLMKNTDFGREGVLQALAFVKAAGRYCVNDGGISERTDRCARFGC